MAFTGANPLSVYKDLVVGAGFDWPFHLIPGNPLGVEPLLAENNLVSTLVQFTPLVLTGLAVAFAFRCGLFNIGGTGQFWVGSVCALLVAQRVGGPTGMVAATLAAGIGGAIWAGIAGGLKAYRGAHEVITTIMLNWIAIYTTQYLFAVSGPLTDNSVGNGVSKTHQDLGAVPRACGASSSRSTSASSSRSAAPSSTTCVLNRTTLGYEVRAVGFNPEAARYGGISVKRSIDRLDGHLRRVRRPRRRRPGARRELLHRRPPTCPCSTSASRASPSRCSAATRPSASCSRRCCSPRCRAAARQLSGSFSPELAGGVSEHHPGHDHPAGRRRADRALAGRARQARARREPTSAAERAATAAAVRRREARRCDTARADRAGRVRAASCCS